MRKRKHLIVHLRSQIDSPLINKYSQIYEDVIEVNDQDVKDEASFVSMVSSIIEPHFVT